jgi:cellulose 1,4-beta-cellobiosidase
MDWAKMLGKKQTGCRSGIQYACSLCHACIYGNSITQEWFDTQNTVIDQEVNPFNDFGGMASMCKGMWLSTVLVMSLWDDYYANMLWLDSAYPTDRDPWSPGAERWQCNVTSGEVEAQVPNAQVVFSNIKFGQIRSSCKQAAGVKWEVAWTEG